MLAPRKTLWSTPCSAIQTASRLSDLCETDTLYDIGCGDGRVLIELASTSPCRDFVGIEIDPDRAAEAEKNVRQAFDEGSVSDDCRVRIECRNALEVDYSEATVVFLYLVPRGLRLIKPLLVEGIRRRNRGRRSKDGAEGTRWPMCPCLRVVTYMSGFTDEKFVKKELCKVEHQVGAAWPVYLYHFESPGE